MGSKTVDAAELIRTSSFVTAFTGAGISTESGIPDFRGPAGIWKRFRPVTLSEFVSDPEKRMEYWRRKLELYPAMKNAEPNNGHRGLADLYGNGYLESVITQNIDGLHQKAGIPEHAVIELHGSNAYISCLSCGKRYEINCR